MRTCTLLIPVIILVLYAGCKKNLVTTIEGQVVNFGSKQPIDSVKVIFNDGWINGGASSSGNRDFAYTDANGHFKITTEVGTPFLYLSKRGYEFVVPSSGSSDDTKYFAPGRYYNVELDLRAVAYFQGVFKGKSSLRNDSVYFDRASERWVTQEISLGWLRKRNHWNFGNGPFSPISEWPVIGDAYFSYWLEYQVQGVWHERIDSVYIKSFTTYRDTIYF